jgi:hypothetical protein
MHHVFIILKNEVLEYFDYTESICRSRSGRDRMVVVISA